MLARLDERRMQSNRITVLSNAAIAAGFVMLLAAMSLSGHVSARDAHPLDPVATGPAEPATPSPAEPAPHSARMLFWMGAACFVGGLVLRVWRISPVNRITPN